MGSAHRQVSGNAWEESRRIVEFDGLRLFVSMRGVSGALPTIILEAGGGGTSAWWAWVQERLAARTLVMRYDRAGLGASGNVVQDDMGATGVAARLEALLFAASLPGPYIFVGHSLGGLFAQHYAATHPDETAGLVLVDPTPSDSTLFGRRNSRVLSLLILVMRACRLLAKLGLLRVFNPAAKLVADLPPHDAHHARMAALDPRHLSGFIRELQEIGGIQKLVSDRPFPRDIPILLASAGIRRSLSAAVADSAGTEKTDDITRHRHDVVAQSDFGRYLVIEGSTHGSIVTKREYAYELADRILEFAESCMPVYERRRAGRTNK